MFEVKYSGKSKEMVEDLNFVSEKSLRKGKVLLGLCKVLDIVLAVGMMALLAANGLTAMFVVWAGIASVVMISVNSIIVVPYKKKVARLEKKKTNLMVDLASNGVLTNDLELTKVAAVDERKEVLVNVGKVDAEGNLKEEEEVFGLVGNVYEYYKMLDRDGKKHFLLVCKRYFERNVKEEPGCYMCFIDYLTSTSVLEKADVEALSPEVLAQIKASEPKKTKKKNVKRG